MFKKIITGLLLAVTAATAFAQGAAPWTVLFRTRNSDNSAYVDKFPPIPATGVTGFLAYDGTSHEPYWVDLGTGFVINSGVVSISPQVQSDWLESNSSAAAFIKNKPTTFATSSSLISDSTSVGRAVLTAADQAAGRTALGASGIFTTLAGYGITDGVTPTSLSSTLSSYVTSSSLTTTLSGYVTTGALSGYVPTSRTINSKALTTNISLDKTDVGLSNVPNTDATNASNITTGTLPVGRLPTGISAANLANGSVSDAELQRLDGVTSNIQTQLDAKGVGSVTSVTAGSGLSGGTITSSGTISLPDVVTSGSYFGVSVDSKGRVTAGQVISINNAPGRSLVAATSATGFQISSTRLADVCYEGTFQTTSTIGGPSSITVFLETANTNSTSPGDWTTIARQVNSNTITLAVVLQQVDIEPWSICRKIEAGKYVRIRYGSVTGTATATINSEQQETLF